MREDLYPAAVAQAHTYRVVHLQPDQAATDFERLEDLLADGLGAAREALTAPGLPRGAEAAMGQPLRLLREHVLGRRRLLSEPCRGALASCIAAARGWSEEHGPTPVLEAVVGGLERALAVSHRVEELLAAEREIGAARGICR